MSYRILTKNAVENTNIDGARDHNFNAGRRSGIVKGALNSGNLFLSANNTIALDTCELRLCGHRVVIDSAEYKTFYNQPSVPIRYSLVAQIIVSNNGESVSFDLKTQLSTTPLVQNDLDKNINGTYELEIGRFTQLTDGTLTDVVRTADLITGGGNNDSEYIRIGTVTTNKISPELDADVDIENTINPDDNKPQTNFTFNLPTSVGTVVSVNGEEKTSINTDITPIASSENLITSGGVHDYPAVTFAESERQKSKNLLVYPYTGKAASSDITITENGDGSFTINGQKTLTDTNSVYFLYTFNNWTDKISSFKLSAGTYTGKVFASVDADIQLVLTDGSMYQNIDVNKNTTFTVAKDAYFEIYLQVPKHNTSVFNNLVVYPMIVKGTDLGDWQPYNGAIVHEKEIADVEHIETIYDIREKNIINTTTEGDKAFTNGIVIGTNIMSTEFAGYKKLIIKSCRNADIITTELYIYNDYANVSGNSVLDQSGDYLVIHSFSFNKENNSFTFSNGGYMYVNTGSSTFTKETAESNNLIVEILGVK